MRLRRRNPSRRELPPGPTLAVTAPLVVEAWPVAMECLRSDLGAAVVDLYPNPTIGSMRATATTPQREAADELTRLALERVSGLKPRSIAYRTRFDQVEFDTTDPAIFALLKTYGPCSIAAEIRRTADGTQLLGTWDEGLILTVTLQAEAECEGFLECVRAHNLDPSIFERS